MLRGIWVSFLAIVTTTVFSAVAAVWSLVHPRSNIAMRLGKVWSRIHLAACGIRPVIHGRENLEVNGPCLYLANHQSTLDIWLTILVLPLPTRIVAKQQLFRIPVLGWALSAAGFIPIDRSNHTRALHSLRSAAKKVRAGRPLLLFPEGTRSRDGTLRPFKKGAFHLALQAGVPVVPISLRGTYEALPPRTIRVRPGPVEVLIHPPVDVTPFRPDDVAGLSGVVREAIASGLRDDPEPPGVRAAGAAER
jgi:1-acyl-sn-glycerol-3-phosphate acyltransferase